MACGYVDSPHFGTVNLGVSLLLMAVENMVHPSTTSPVQHSVHRSRDVYFHAIISRLSTGISTGGVAISELTYAELRCLTEFVSC